jgi:uncharacterized protein YhdP
VLAVGAKIWPYRRGFRYRGDTLTLANGLVDTGFGRLTTDGVWVNAPAGVRTSLKGKLHGNKTDDFVNFFGVSTPVKVRRLISIMICTGVRRRGSPTLPRLTGS